MTRRHSHFEKYNWASFWEFVKKNFFALVVPYLLCALIFQQFDIMAVASLIAKIPEKAFGDKIHRFLSWLGRSTMGIYLIHVPITRQWIAPAFEKSFGLARMSFAGGLVSGTVSLAISCVLMAVIERYIPQLFGKKLGKAYE